MPSQPSCSHHNTIYDSQLQKTKSILHAATAARNLDAAIPLRSAQAELQSTIAQRQPQKRKSHLDTSVTVRAQFQKDSTANRGSPRPLRKRANFSPRRNLRLPEKTMFRADPNIQITSLMLQFQCDLPTTCKTQSESQQMTQEQVAFEEPWRSYSTAICRDRVAKHKSLVVAAAPGRAAHRPILSEHARRCAISRHAAQAGMQNWQLGALTERLWRARLCCLRDRHAKGVHLTGAINAPRDVTARDKMLRLQRGWTLVPQPTRFEWKYIWCLENARRGANVESWNDCQCGLDEAWMKRWEAVIL